MLLWSESMSDSFIEPIASSLIPPAGSSLITTITWQGKEGGFLPLFTLSLMMKFLGKGVRGAGRRYNNMDKNF